jgi:phosphomannomutase
MALIKSISGIRGTIGGRPGETLSPIDIVKFSSAYAKWLKEQNHSNKTVVIGRDARTSGEMVNGLVCQTLRAMGLNIIDLGLSTTPTVELAVEAKKAAGGIILTASHNPSQWNALKLLNSKGEFVSESDSQKILEYAENENFEYVAPAHLGSYVKDDTFLEKHIEMVLALPLVNREAIKAKNFKIAVDAVNSSGGIAVPKLLKALGVSQVIEVFCEPNGIFPHNPEPLPEHLTQICMVVKDENCHLGIVVDPDVDRLALISENGSPFDEEYTLVAVADYVLKNQPGATVSNLSSTRALRDITQKHGNQYFAAAVGEVNVVAAMKEHQAVIGGEGNGGVIYPELHYGRDALVGIALFLSHLAQYQGSASKLRASYPEYYISKNKIELSEDINVDLILEKVFERYKNQQISRIDGVKIDFENEWVHLRKSNTEPIIRIYAESASKATAEHLAAKIISDIREVIMS